MDERANPITGRLIVGVMLLLLGVMWTFDNLGFIDASEYLRWWPGLLIVFGVMKLGGLGVQRSTGSGLFFTLVGFVLLMGALGWVHVSLWPLFLIAAGISYITRSLRRDGASGGGDAGDWVNSFAMMGGVVRRSSSPAFRGGDLSALMGGVQLDLTDAKPEGGRAVIDVLAIWGGVEIRVPDDWRVEVEVTPVMGAFEDSTRLAPDAQVAGVLVVRGFVLMGGGEVKNGALEPESRMRVGVHRIHTKDSVVINKVSTDRDGWSTRKEVTVGPMGVVIRRSSGPAEQAAEPGATTGSETPPPTEPR